MQRVVAKINSLFNSVKLKIDSNPNYLFTVGYIVKVLFFYLLFSYAVDGYIALIDSNGKYNFSQTLGKFNFVELLRDSILSSSVWILKLLNYTTFASAYTIGIVGSGGVRLGYSCIGIKLLIALIILVACFPAKAKNKFLFLLVALPIMHLLNIIRITILALLSKSIYVSHLEYHHEIFNFIIYIYIACSFYLFMEYFSGIKRLNAKASVQ
jgi:exosortase/archaeosortase family protein